MQEEGRQEGRLQGLLIGKIQVLQDLLGSPETPAEELATNSVPELEAELARLRKEIDGIQRKH